MKDPPGVSLSLSIGAELLVGRGGRRCTADPGFFGEPTAPGACLSRDAVLSTGGFDGRLARRGSREDGVLGPLFGLSKSILSDMLRL